MAITGKPGWTNILLGHLIIFAFDSTAPICVINDNWSHSFHISIILPSLNFPNPMPETTACFPLGSMPSCGPKWVSETVKRAATKSSCATISSTSMRISGKALVNVSANDLNWAMPTTTSSFSPRPWALVPSVIISAIRSKLRLFQTSLNHRRTEFLFISCSVIDTPIFHSRQFCISTLEGSALECIPAGNRQRIQIWLARVAQIVHQVDQHKNVGKFETVHRD